MIGAATLGRLASPQDDLATGMLPPEQSQNLRLAEAALDQPSQFFDPRPILRTESLGFPAAPLSATLRSSQPDVVQVAVLEPPAAIARDVLPAANSVVAAVAQSVPLPMRRPFEFRPSREAARTPRGPYTPRVAELARTNVQAERSFFETVFGFEPEPTRALAYAPTEPNTLDLGTRRLVPATPSARAEGSTAVYDISARTVTLPNGERLEAHSGLGAAMDNPRSVHLRMRGSTPPGVYDLTQREALFHGVRAIRLNPVGGSAAIHGRDGILAHTYMLGPSGASNGCVSFKDYNRFLQAFLRGDVRRLVVIGGDGGDLPAIAGRGRRRIADAGSNGR